MSTINYIPDRKREHFTYYSLSPSAILQLQEFSKADRDIADGEALHSLVERKVCDETGKFNMDRLQAQSLVTAAYAEGWHVRFK